MSKLRLTALSILAVAAAMILPACSKREGRVSMNLPDKFEGKTVELITFADSAIVCSGDVEKGKVDLIIPDSLLDNPRLLQVMVDGRVRAYYISEPGKAEVSDSLGVATGTRLNDRFASLMQRLDSLENLNDMPIYLAEVERMYNDNRDNVLSEWFGVEWIKYADPAAVDSMLKLAPREFRESAKVKYYERFAQLRASTAPGSVYVDFAGKDEKGRSRKFSSYVVPGKYTIVDFWASWCPYCIKELPDLADLYARRQALGVEIVGVAVRDLPEDTRAMVEKKQIPWKIMYETGRTPYDIYGFSGIPHLMLIGPDGKIISRGESVASIDARLGEALDNPEI